MNKSLLSLAAMGTGLLAASLFASPALAGHVDVGVNIGVPMYMPAAPVYVQPAPVYAPPPVVYAPPPVVYVRPAPVYMERDKHHRRGNGYYRHHGHPPHHPGPYYRQW